MHAGRGRRSQSPHAIVLRVVLDLSESQHFHHGWHVHSEAAAKTLLQTVPTADRILWRATPGFDGSFLRWLLLVRAAQLDPIAVLLEHGVEVGHTAQMVSQLRLADRDYQGRWIHRFVAIRLELRRPWRRFQSPRLLPRAHAFGVSFCHLVTPLCAEALAIVAGVMKMSHGRF